MGALDGLGLRGCLDRRTEEHVAKTSFDVMESRYVVPDLMKMITLGARSGE